MAAKQASQGSQRPDLETQRAILKQKLDGFRATGFDAEVTLAAAKVQEGDDRDEMVKNLEQKIINCYAAAREVAALLAKLPKPKAKPDDTR